MLEQHWQVTRMINMGMGQHKVFNTAWFDWKARTVAQA